MRKISSLLLACLLLFISACASKPKASIEFPTEKKLIVLRPVRNKYVITQRYRPKRNRKHKGVDLAGKKNDPIFSMSDGTVLYKGNKFSGYGNMIIIEHSFGISTLYSHLNKIYVKSGDKVKAGQEIGAMGKTGRATGVHLHFEVMEEKIPVDPEKYLKL